MATETFPAGELVGVSEKPRPNVRRTEFESGDQKQSRRFARTLIDMEANYLFTAAEYAAFKTWFFDTINYGATWFNWDNPVSGTTVDARIVGGVYEAAPVSAALNHYSVTLTMEVYSA